MVINMPRKSRGRYAKFLENLRGAGAVPPAATGDEEDVKLYKFHQFLIGKSKIKQTNKIPEGARKLYQVGLLPFSLSATTSTPADRYVGYASAYSLAALKDRGGNLTEAKLGINLIVGGEKEDAGYYPALIRASFATTSASVVAAKVSAVTGTKYKYDYKRTFSFPFGRTTTSVKDAKTGTTETTVDDADAMDVYRSAVDALKSNTTNTNVPTTVSYDPEVFKTKTKGEAYKTGTNLPAIAVG
jgi:hypothetical protein